MIENKYPIFGNGQVINKEALDLLRDNPAELTDLLYLDKKDGIIYATPVTDLCAFSVSLFFLIREFRMMPKHNVTK